MAQIKYSNKVIATVIAIVNVFENGRALGAYASVAVLDDGAGVSYGIGQFTHRSGSLLQVVERFLINKEDHPLGRYLPQLKRRTKAAIEKLAADAAFKNELRDAADTRDMQLAQVQVLFERYLTPAVSVCEKLNFKLPLSLAVVYDSLVHGSFSTIAAKVKAKDERGWIAEYVHLRDAWLASVKRLQKTRYRTAFFVEQIKRNNWDLDLPLIANGRRLDSITIDAVTSVLFEYTSTDSADGPASQTAETHNETRIEPADNGTPMDSRPPNKTSALESIESCVNDAAARYDRVEAVVKTVTTRADSAKSLWATLLGTIWQAVWALIGLVLGVPKEVWLVVAVVAGMLAVLYLYRQFVLGRIREMREQGENQNA